MTIDAKEAARLYRERSLEGASPARIVRLLLEGALRRIDRAGAQDAQNPRSSYVAELQRAEEIVTELRLAIDAEQGGEVAQKTEALYDFAAERLARAITQREPGLALEARAVLASLHDAWRTIDEGGA